MVSITGLKRIVSQGWTIANRNMIKTRIGENNFADVIKLTEKLPLNGGYMRFECAEKFLRPENINKTKRVLQNTSDYLNGRWTNPSIDYAPSIINESTQVPMHHGLNGRNLEIRRLMSELNKSTPDIEEIFCYKGLIKHLREIDLAFTRVTPLEKDCIGYRGRTFHPVIKIANADFELIKNVKKGDIIVPDTAYSYFGFDESLARHWADPIREDIPTIIYETRFPKDSLVSRNLEHGGEIVTPRGAAYKVIDIKKNIRGNETRVIMEYLPNQKDNLSEIENVIANIT